MINSIDLPKLRNSEYIQFLKDVLGITAANDTAALNVQPQYNNLQAMLGSLEALFVTEQGSPMTDQVTALDTRRDNAITGITAFANSYTYYFDPVLAGHGTNLSWQINQYGSGIARENYQGETTIITSIVEDCRTKPELVAAVSALGLGAWLHELETANKAFNDAYLQRTRQLGAASEESIFIKRTAANAAYYELRDFINSYFTINKGAAPYSKASGELNALIDQYNTMLAGRGAKAAPVAPVAAA